MRPSNHQEDTMTTTQLDPEDVKRVLPWLSNAP
jgi:hypothetical protein